MLVTTYLSKSEIVSSFQRFVYIFLLSSGPITVSIVGRIFNGQQF